MLAGGYLRDRFLVQDLLALDAWMANVIVPPYPHKSIAGNPTDSKIQFHI